MITFKPTRNIDLIEHVANIPDIQDGTANGNYFSYNSQEIYFEVGVHNEFAGIIRAIEVQPKSYECHAMFLENMRGFSRDIGISFWSYFFANYPVECVLSMASDKFRKGKFYCASIGLRRRGVIPKFFDGKTDVTIYSATREEIFEFISKERR
ncbi:DUF2824 family protein [Providencia rettgeri]